jgi:hypothetical protein
LARPPAATRTYSRQDAENAKKTGPRCSYPLRSWRLCEIPNSLGFNDLRRVCSRIFARRQDVAPFQCQARKEAKERERNLPHRPSAGTKITSHKGTKPRRKDPIRVSADCQPATDYGLPRTGSSPRKTRTMRKTERRRRQAISGTIINRKSSIINSKATDSRLLTTDYAD